MLVCTCVLVTRWDSDASTHGSISTGTRGVSTFEMFLLGLMFGHATAQGGPTPLRGDASGSDSVNGV